MIKVECYSGYKLNETPVAFTLMGRRYVVTDIIDRWFGEDSTHFKVKADDGNIYLLKYDEWEDRWDLIFYQNPKRLEGLPNAYPGFKLCFHSSNYLSEIKRFTSLH